MCLGIPGEVMEVLTDRPDLATVDVSGVARAVNIGATDFWAKGGVMIRETLRSDSRNAFMLETPNGHDEPVFQSDS